MSQRTRYHPYLTQRSKDQPTKEPVLYKTLYALLESHPNTTSLPITTPQTFSCKLFCPTDDSEIEVSCGYTSSIYTDFCKHIAKHSAGLALPVCSWPNCPPLARKANKISKHVLSMHVAKFVCPFTECREPLERGNKTRGGTYEFIKHLVLEHDVFVEYVDCNLIAVALDG